MDFGTVLGLLIGLIGIVGGNAIEGGHFAALVQETAFMIVFGGTLGATMVSSNGEDLRRALSLFSSIFKNTDERRLQKIARDLHEAAKLVRQEGPLALEGKIKAYDPFMQRAVRAYVDGLIAEQIRAVFDSVLDAEERRVQAAAKVWTDAGGFAPTIGILGAVLGLIHVMGNLSDTSQLGKGIATAFVATIYGVGSANLMFLPFANKIKSKGQQEIFVKETIIDCMAMLATGQSPAMIHSRAQAILANPTEQA